METMSPTEQNDHLVGRVGVGVSVGVSVGVLIITSIIIIITVYKV